MNNNVHIMNHPLISHKITMLRDKNTTVKDFRQLVYEISLLMGYEATKNLPLEDINIETPLTKTVGKVISQKVAIIPILRAGLGMVDGILDLMPAAKVGHIGLHRDHETLKPVEYYCKLPRDIAKHKVIVVDPMLATGGSSAAAISFIKERGGKDIKLMCIIGSPEGVKIMEEAHPDVEIYVGALDERLNEKGYILPGLGDAGDRIYGTL
ncbi:MAG: uracil phosphoribosyltransferase [Clostridiales bacterium]